MSGVTVAEMISAVVLLGQAANVFLTYKIKLDILSELQPIRERLSRLEGRAGIMPAE